MEKFINDKGRIRELVRVASADSECGYITTYRDAMKDGDVEFSVEVVEEKSAAAPVEVDQAPPPEPKAAATKKSKK